MDWFLYDNGLRHKRVKSGDPNHFLITLIFVTFDNISTMGNQFANNLVKQEKFVKIMLYLNLAYWDKKRVLSSTCQSFGRRHGLTSHDWAVNDA